MKLTWQGIVQAFWLIVRGDPEVMAITWQSVKLSGIATASSLALGIPLGTLIGLARSHA